METQDKETKIRRKRKPDKKRKLRMKRRFTVFVFLFVCTSIIFTVLKAPFFNVDEIVCVGQQELSEEKIIQIAGAKTGSNVFSVGVKEMKRRLFENPAIAECNVRRLFPNKIKIWVRESKAVGYIETESGFLLVDKNGQIIKILKPEEKDKVLTIAKLDGYTTTASKLGEYVNKEGSQTDNIIFGCINLLDKLEMIDNVTMISATDSSNIKIDYQNRLYIMLGDFEQAEYKLTFVKKVITENLSAYEKAILDYRGKNLYVAPRNEEEEPQELPKGEGSASEEEKTFEDEQAEEPQNSEAEDENNENTQ